MVSLTGTLDQLFNAGFKWLSREVLLRRDTAALGLTLSRKGNGRNQTQAAV